MKIQLTRKLAERIDDIDLSHQRVGDLIDLTRHDAEMLIAEGWASPADSASDTRAALRDRADDRPPRKRTPRKHR